MRETGRKPGKRLTAASGFGFLEDLQAKDTSESLKNGRAVTEGMAARLPCPSAQERR
jgi:hypothetical protein